MTEEQKLRKLAPAGNPFRVPDGYFETLTRRTMDNIRKQESHRRHISWFRWSAAAAIAGIIVTAGFFALDNDTHEVSFAENENSITSEELEYAMIDNQDIEYYLTEAGD